MASPKALAAIALTLIVAMPLCLGYALANEETTAEEWQSTNTVNVSEALLNSSSPIYADYSDSLNNSLLIRASGNMNSYAPAYKTVSQNYTSLPIYTSASGTLTLTNPTTVTGAASWNGSQMSQFMVGGNAGGSLIDGDVVSLNFSPDTLTKMDGYNSSSDRLNIPLNRGSQTVNFFKNSDGTYTTTYNNQTYTYKYFLFYPTTGSQSNYCTITCKMNDLQQVSIPYNNWSINFGSIAVLLKMNDSNSIWVHSDTAQTLSKINDTVIFNGVTYSGISEIYVADVKNPNTHTYTYQTLAGTYADPSDGWNIAAQFGMRWSNTFHNEYVRMMVHFEDTAFTTTYLASQDSSFTNLGYTMRFDYEPSTGMLRINNNDFGHYSDVMVEFYKDKTVISGLQNGWPSMGSMPQVFNTVTSLNTLNPGEIDFIQIAITTYTNTSFRVDDAHVLAGSFPSTKDKVLVMDELFPGESFNLKLNSIGVYGSSISIGTNTYAVNNGRITVGAHSVPLKGAVISSLYNGSVYENYIGGYSVGTSSSPANVTFSGEWSLTATANIMEKVQVTERNWAPGQFVFDDQESFSGALIFAAAVAFVGVGLYGARSGNKIGLLLIVCGGVLLIAINLV